MAYASRSFDPDGDGPFRLPAYRRVTLSVNF